MAYIPQGHLDDILKKIDSNRFKEQHKAYVKGLFDQHASGGISREEVRKGIQQLKQDLHDGIDGRTAEKVEKALLDHLDEKKSSKPQTTE